MTTDSTNTNTNTNSNTNTTPHPSTLYHTTPYHTLSTSPPYPQAGCRVQSPPQQGPGTALAAVY